MMKYLNNFIRYSHPCLTTLRLSTSGVAILDALILLMAKSYASSLAYATEFYNILTSIHKGSSCYLG